MRDDTGAAGSGYGGVQPGFRPADTTLESACSGGASLREYRISACRAVLLLLAVLGVPLGGPLADEIAGAAVEVFAEEALQVESAEPAPITSYRSDLGTACGSSRGRTSISVPPASATVRSNSVPSTWRPRPAR